MIIALPRFFKHSFSVSLLLMRLLKGLGLQEYKSAHKCLQYRARRSYHFTRDLLAELDARGMYSQSTKYVHVGEYEEKSNVALRKSCSYH